jgi:hypothetical protein
MREISPAIGMSVEEYLNLAPEIRPLIMEIRRQKESGSRLRTKAKSDEFQANSPRQEEPAVF